MSKDDKKDRTNGERLKQLGQRLGADWDRRISHDYRFWMSDGVQDDAAMWRTGARDFAILTAGIDPEWSRSKRALELGCGVGRILRSAAAEFKEVVGIDVSEQALSEAKRLLADCSNVTLVQGNGIDLGAIETGSIDFAYTFAALSSMPVAVTAAYLLELNRVMKPDATVRLQVYLGHEQDTREEDSIAIRSYRVECFEQGVSLAGFNLSSVRELRLPFEISDRDAGLVAHIVTLVRKQDASATVSQIAEAMAPAGEQPAEANWEGSRTEYLMALSRAEQHMNAGRKEKAAEALDYAVKHYGKPDGDVQQMLNDMAIRVAASERPVTREASFQGAAGVTETLERNLAVLRRRFPEAESELRRLLSGAKATADGDMATLVQSGTGESIVYCGGVDLDNREKPERAAAVWAERSLNNPRIRQAKAVVLFGFAGGYHVEQLQRNLNSPLHVVEPRADVLLAALRSRDYTGILERLASLTLGTVESDLRRNLGEVLKSSELIFHAPTQLVSRDASDDLKRLAGATRGLAELRPSIAVVGPIYGGSQPIGAYTFRALQELKQRAHYYDMAEFASTYFKFGDVIREGARVDQLKSSYVELLSQIVLEGVTERPVDMVICLAQAPLSPRVLTELRKRGIITVMWFVEDCRRFLTWKAIAPYFDYMFLIQRDGFPALVEQAGAGRAIYLPVGFDPMVHYPTQVTPEERERFGSELSFVGAGYNNRQQMFAALAGRDFKIWGTEWPGVMPFNKLVQERGRRITPGEYVKIFNASAINLNLHSSMERDGVEPFGDFVNPRTFELAGCGAFQLVDDRLLLGELFEKGKEVITFNNKQELEEQIEYYSAHPAERAAIAAKSRERALRDHSYTDRVRAMLGYIYADRYEQLSSKFEESAWQRTFKAVEPFPELKHRFDKVFERGAEPKLDEVVADIQTGKGSLTEEEQKLLFLFHVKKQISFVNELREGKNP